MVQLVVLRRTVTRVRIPDDCVEQLEDAVERLVRVLEHEHFQTEAQDGSQDAGNGRVDQGDVGGVIEGFLVAGDYG